MTGQKGVLFYPELGLGNSMVALTAYAPAYQVPMLVLARDKNSDASATRMA